MNTACQLTASSRGNATYSIETRQPAAISSGHTIGVGAVTASSVKTQGAAETMVEVNGRRSAAPKRPTVVIVVDGFDPAYLEHGFANGTLPTMKSFERIGFVSIADCSIPSTPH